MNDGQAMRDAFEKDGYCLVRGVLGAKRMAEIRSLLEDKFHERFQDEDLLRADIIPDHMVLYPELVDTFFNDRVLDAVRSLFGEEIVLLAFSAIRNSYNRLHSDFTTAEGTGARFFLKPDFQALTVGIYLQDHDAQGGGLFVVPGSHKRRDPLVERRRLEKGIGVPLLAGIARKLTGSRFPRYEDYAAFERGGYDLPTRAGDAVLLDMRLLHRGSKATASRTRTKLALFYHVSPPGERCDEHVAFLHSPAGHSHLNEVRDLAPLVAAARGMGCTVL